MKLVTRFGSAALAAVLLTVLAACGGGSTPTDGGGAGGGLAVSARGEELAFDPTTLTATAGAQTTVTFNNPSTANNHNWVLVNGGDDVATQVNDASVEASTVGYATTGPNVVAATKTLGPNSNEAVTFTAPAAGTYTFLCTVPGHYAAGMKGTLTVQ
jgi:plastocyanin